MVAGCGERARKGGGPALAQPVLLGQDAQQGHGYGPCGGPLCCHLPMCCIPGCSLLAASPSCPRPTLNAPAAGRALVQGRGGRNSF